MPALPPLARDRARDCHARTPERPPTDALVLARMQFAANITFHILFPTINIALGWVLLFFRWRWLATRHGADAQGAQSWLDAYRFWTKVFALRG